MGGKVGNTEGGPMADINVTPLVDVVLVLLIIFMVVTPLLSSGIDVSLPKARTTEATQDVGQHIVIGIRNDGVVFIDTEQTTLEDLIPDINEAFRDNPARSILIKADSHLPYRTVREVMDAIAEGGMTTLLLAAEKYEDKAGE